MKSKNKLPFTIGIILLSITSIYPFNINKSDISQPAKEVYFWTNHQLNWNDTKQFNENPYWSQEETYYVNDCTITISNKKISVSNDYSFEDNKRKNKPTSYKTGNIRCKGFRFQNLNIPFNATNNNTELILYDYSKGDTTLKLKTENLKPSTSYLNDDEYLSSRSTTSKSADWFIPTLFNGLELKSPNLKDVVQEVVNSKNGITQLSLIILSSKKWYTNESKCEVTNNLYKKYVYDELHMNRNINVKTHIYYNYLSVYKSLLPKTIFEDYSANKYLSFSSIDKEPTQLVFVKVGRENWRNQCKTTINLTEEAQTFFIPFASFSSIAFTDKILTNNLTSFSLTYIALDSGTNNLDLKISAIRFTKINAALGTDEFISPKKNEFFAYLNPSKRDLNYTISIDNKTNSKTT
jgi:hypothetical protein